MTDTLVEDLESQGDETSTPRGWLICIGSPEDGFASAGRIVTLDGVSRARFCRVDEAEGVEVSEIEGGLEIGIPFGWVSGNHAELSVESDVGGLRFSLQDLDSRNGTLVNGQRIKGTVPLRPGDIVEVGRSFWTVRQVRMRKPRTHKLAEFDPTGTCNPHLHHVHRTLRRLAQSTIPIVLRGETGTGKEYLARAIHRVSGRSGRFVVANLAALSEHRVETVLYGDGSRPGLFEEADGGTLLLDELGELGNAVQAKLLTALADSTEDGTSHPRQYDVRLIASTVHDVHQLVHAGRFRGDLYSRLAGYVAELPPLRARREDLGLLCRSFIRSMQQDGRPTRITTNAFRRVLGRAWPFNVRQLAQTLTTASLLASGDGTITSDAIAEILEEDDGLPQNPDEVRRLRATLVSQLAEHQGNTEEVARAMNQDPYRIQRWLERFAIAAESYQQ